MCIRIFILTKKLEDFLETDQYQDFIFQWEVRSDHVVKFRGPEPVIF